MREGGDREREREREREKERERVFSHFPGDGDGGCEGFLEAAVSGDGGYHSGECPSHDEEALQVSSKNRLVSLASTTLVEVFFKHV